MAPVNFLPISTPGTPPITAFVKQIPNLFGLCFAIKTVPHRVTLRIKEFLEELVTEIPDDNILRFHFNNILLLLSTYKNIIDAKKDAFRRFTDVIEDLETNQLPTMFQNRHIDDDIPDDKPSLPNLPKRLGFLSPLNGTPFTPFMQKPFFGGRNGQKRTPTRNPFDFF